jgi:hypothetical protein
MPFRPFLVAGLAQIGEGHTASTVQEGKGNMLGVIQLGRD